MKKNDLAAVNALGSFLFLHEKNLNKRLIKNN
jgi:hypothetical protein